MTEDRVSSHVAAALLQLEALAAQVHDVRDPDHALPRALETLRTTLSELQANSEELQAQNAELHAARQLVERDRARYQDLFDLAPEPYLVTDFDGVVLEANRQAEKLFDQSGRPLRGKPLGQFVTSEDSADFERVLTWLAEGYGMHGWELRLRVDGETPVVLASVEPAPSRSGGTELRWVLSDATSTMVARRRLVDLLEASRGEASELRVMTEYQATLLGAAAHDLRTPMAAIDAGLAAAQERTAVRADGELRELLSDAAGTAASVRRLLPGLLHLGRLQATHVVAQRVTVDVRSVVEQVCSIVGVDAERIDCDLHVDELLADQLQLERILENLVENALHHTPRDGVVQVRTRARGVDVLLTVDDAGRGVPEELREQVFSPFTRVATAEEAPEPFSGGLGLALVALFAAMHGGRAWVETSDLGGASFHVLLSAALPDLD